MLARNPDFQVDAELSDGIDLLSYMDAGGPLPDVILLDITMPRLRGIEATRRIKSVHPQIKVLILTVHKEKEYLNAALSAGAEGYVLKDSADVELLPAISAVRNGDTYISRFFQSGD
jgi:DNA-binding NarL/FixJ family response regulator